jgi:hypothetical protein
LVFRIIDPGAGRPFGGHWIRFVRHRLVSHRLVVELLFGD